MSSIEQIIIDSVVSFNRERKVYILKGFNHWLDQISHYLGDIFVGTLPTASKDAKLSLQQFSTKLEAGDPVFITYENLIWLDNNSLAGLPSVYGFNYVCIDNDLFDTYYPDTHSSSDVLAKQDMFSADSDNYIQNYYGDIEIRESTGFVLYNKAASIEHETLSLSSILRSHRANAGVEITHIPEEYDNVSLAAIILDIIQSDYGVIEVLSEHSEQPRMKQLLNALRSLGLKVSFYEYDVASEEVDQQRAVSYRSILRRKNPNYDFYDIDVYSNPYESTETAKVNQLQIVESIVSNSLLAQSNASFRDVFVTAPTGAGKSVMFQVPAIYLAEQNDLLTIVVSPLIGLMNDQVDNIKAMTSMAATINSDYTPLEKEATLERVKSGEVSILYLSPESLLSNTDITSLIGDRRIGLFVVDEAHIVATWGKSFRPDYWYLGDFIHKLRNDKATNHRFPIATFTATATFGGNDNMYQEIIDSLHMTPVKYIGNVRRNDISFSIAHRTKDHAYKEEKLNVAIDTINKLHSSGDKTLVYTAYTQHIRDIYAKLDNPDRAGRYYGGMNAADKNETLNDIKNGKKNLVIATKAFGMGIDIDDIKNVYHYAPTGNIADYIQEIGRAARRKGMEGIAITDFYKEDFRYINQLYGMSSIKNYQVVGVLRKIYDLYTKYNRRNFLVSPEEFSYIFADQRPDEIDAKLKTTLLIIKKDFEVSSQNFAPLIFKPRGLFTKAYFTVKDDFISHLESGKLMEFFEKTDTPRKIQVMERGALVTVKQAGDTYRLDFKRLWESRFRDMSFGMFKRKFYENELPGFNFRVGESLLQRTIITIEGGSVTLGAISESLVTFLNAIQVIFDDLKQQGKHFGVVELTAAILAKTNVKQKSIATMLASTIVELLRRVDTQSLASHYGFSSYNTTTNKWVIRNNGYERNIRTLIRCARSMLSNTQATHTVRYCSSKSDGHEIIVAQLIELLDIADATISSGTNPEFFIRVNSPSAIERIVTSKNYHSRTVGLVYERHKESVKLMEYFFTILKTDDERWSFIEDYFLGLLNMREINERLGVSEPDVSLPVEATKPSDNQLYLT